MQKPIFHLAFPIHDPDLAKQFYIDGLGFNLGRENKHALIIHCQGHQIVAHVVDSALPEPESVYPHHFGLIFSTEQEWQALLDRVKHKALPLFTQPKVRFPGMPIEHKSFFVKDPSNNLLEFKYYTHEASIFGAKAVNQIGDL